MSDGGTRGAMSRGIYMRRYFATTLMGLMLMSLSPAFAADDEADKKADTPAATEEAKPAAKEKPAKKEKPKKAEKESKPAEKKAEKESKPEKKADAGAKKKSSGAGGVGGVASSIGSFVAGTFVGIPVSIFRKSKTETINATKDLVGDTDKKWLIGAAGVLGVPAGILSGVAQGFVYGPLNAYRGTKDEPFSPEAFSLGDSK